MRQKKIKGINEQMLASKGVVSNGNKLIFHNDAIINLEIGSGKGQFISQLAKANENEIFIAFEKNVSICYRIVEKRDELKLSNLFIILDDAINVSNYLNNNGITNIYLNFPDPWPKERHHKRRLTNESFLKLYTSLLKENGKIQFRTDHNDFFEDSIKYFKNNLSLKIIEINRNTAESNYMSEYEIKKRLNNNINQLIGVKKNG